MTGTNFTLRRTCLLHTAKYRRNLKLLFGLVCFRFVLGHDVCLLGSPDEGGLRLKVRFFFFSTVAADSWLPIEKKKKGQYLAEQLTCGLICWTNQ